MYLELLNKASLICYGAVLERSDLVVICTYLLFMSPPPFINRNFFLLCDVVTLIVFLFCFPEKELERKVNLLSSV